MLTRALDSAITGLHTTQQRLDTVGRNVANAGTDGYTRKTQEQVTSASGGVMAGEIRRVVEDILIKEARAASSSSEEINTRLDALKRLDSLVGSVENGGDLAAAIGKLVSAYHAAAAQPQNQELLADVTAAAERLTQVFHSQSEGVARLRADTAKSGADDAARATAILAEMPSLDARIGEARAAKADTTDLEDRRDQLLQELSGLMRISAFVDESGHAQVSASDGTRLYANGQSARIGFSAAGVMTVDGRTVAPAGGSLGGRQILLTRTYPDRLGQLDQIAAALTTAMTAAGTELFQDGGVSYVGGALDGYAGRIAVNPTYLNTPTRLRGAPATPSGDATALLAALGALESGGKVFTASGLPSTGSLADAAAGAVAAHASETRALDGEKEAASALATHLAARRADKSEVKIDDEMAAMLVLQNAYSASARVVETTRAMLDDLLRMAG